PEEAGDTAAYPILTPFQVLRDEVKMKDRPGSPQPERILGFIRKGEYLNRPWKFVAQYVTGLLLNLLVFSSGLVFLCALLAFSWRLLDQPTLSLPELFASVWDPTQLPRETEGLWYELAPEQVRYELPLVICFGLWVVAGITTMVVNRLARRKVVPWEFSWLPKRWTWVAALLALWLILSPHTEPIRFLQTFLPGNWSPGLKEGILLLIMAGLGAVIACRSR